MGAAGTRVQELEVRLNDVDWDILKVMSDGRRYTQQHLYDDRPELDEYSDDWIRKRISHLHDNGMIKRVGSSSMYIISEYGRAALELEDEITDDMSPIEIGQMVRSHVEE